MNEEEIEKLLDYYPYQQSVQHSEKTLNKNWYPISNKRFGFLLCPNCDEYSGEKFAKYSEFDIINKSINIYHCLSCHCIFDVCQVCLSFCVVIDNVSNKSVINESKELYNIIKKLNRSLVNIIYQYSLFDKLYTFYTDEKKLNCFCPRCEKKHSIKKTNLY